MKFYIDLTISGNGSVSEKINATYSNIHKFLCRTNYNDIAVTFPQMSDNSMGRKIRCFCNDVDKLTQLSTYVKTNVVVISETMDVPTQCQWINLTRHKADNGRSRLRRIQKRAEQRNDGSIINVQQYNKNACQNIHQMPYVTLISNTNGNVYKLWFKQQAGSKPNYDNNSFDHYGISTNAVPFF